MIRDNMMRWLNQHYNVTEVIHDGAEFEYHGLKYLQDWCIENNQPALYLHTRGAYHKTWTSPITHKLWELEYGAKKQGYWNAVDNIEPVVACMFTDSDNHFWYNGAIMNPAAMAAIPPIRIDSNRFYYEDLFKGYDVKMFYTLRYGDIHHARAYLKYYKENHM